MLILTRKKDETIVFEYRGTTIAEVIVADVDDSKRVTLGVTAPREIVVYRKELAAPKEKEARRAEP